MLNEIVPGTTARSGSNDLPLTLREMDVDAENPGYPVLVSTTTSLDNRPTDRGLLTAVK